MRTTPERLAMLLTLRNANFISAWVRLLRVPISPCRWRGFGEEPPWSRLFDTVSVRTWFMKRCKKQSANPGDHVGPFCLQKQGKDKLLSIETCQACGNSVLRTVLRR